MQVHFKCYEVLLWFLLLYLGNGIWRTREKSKDNYSFSVLFLRKNLTWKHWLGIFAVVVGLSIVGVSDVIFSKQPEGNHTNAEKLAGDALILIAMLFTSFQVRMKNKINEKQNTIIYYTYRSFMKNVLLVNIIFHLYKLLVGKEYSDFLLLAFF